MARYKGEEFPVEEFRAWLAADPARADMILSGLRLMDEAEAARRMQDPSAPGYYARARHIDVLVAAVEQGIIPNDWVVCHTPEETDAFMRDILDGSDDEQDHRESVSDVLSEMLGWEPAYTPADKSKAMRDAEFLKLKNLGTYWTICRQMKKMREDAGVSYDEMARRTGLSAVAFWNAEHDLHRTGLLDLLPDYCTALGKTFTVTIHDAEDGVDGNNAGKRD
ncbi:helix-turn-helix domain-containing protein [Bifidobacterium biavatii]|nr:helix-turn-helix domain-containing protein [Bifidobacterium biavatii]